MYEAYEALEDLVVIHHLDAEQMLTDMLSEEISREIDAEITGDVRNVTEAVATFGGRNLFLSEEAMEDIWAWGATYDSGIFIQQETDKVNWKKEGF